MKNKYFKKDEQSGAIINSDIEEYKRYHQTQQYHERFAKLEQEISELRLIIKEINNNITETRNNG